MTHDGMDLAMFWTGALLVFTPIVAAGTVLGVWWWGKRKRDSAPEARHPSP